MALCPFYTIYYPFHCLAASLYGFTLVQCEHSVAHEREKRERNPYCDPIRFYADDNIPLRSSRRHRDAGFPIIYLYLSVRLKKVDGFIRFSIFFALKTAVYSAFFNGFFLPRQERTRIMCTGKYRNRRRIRCLCNRLKVFCNRHTASLYRHTASLYRISTVIC
jgi:hypothetical protein